MGWAPASAIRGVEAPLWTVDPFGAVVKNGFVYGRGTMDFKGGLAAFTVAAMRLARSGVALKRDVILLAEADEEGGDYGTGWLAENHWDKIDAGVSLNEGGWPTQGVSYCVGFLGNVATFVGADASVHLAEEVSNPAVNIPKAIIGAMLINGSVGFAMMVTILYCLGDVDSVLNSKTAFPFIQIFFNSVGNVAGATVMAAVVLALTWACSIGITTTASRMTWSFV